MSTARTTPAQNPRGRTRIKLLPSLADVGRSLILHPQKFYNTLSRAGTVRATFWRARSRNLPGALHPGGVKCTLSLSGVHNGDPGVDAGLLASLVNVAALRDARHACVCTAGREGVRLKLSGSGTTRLNQTRRGGTEMKKGLSRRDFVKTAATGIGITAIGGIGAQ